MVFRCLILNKSSIGVSAAFLLRHYIVYERKLQLMSREKTGRAFQRGKKQGARLDEHGGNAYT